MAAPRTLEAKQAEKDRLLKRYRAKLRADWAALLESEPRFAEFRRALRRCTAPGEILTRLAESWLRHAPAEHRYTALRLIDAHSARMARYEGRAPLDDPLPPATNLYFTARRMLAVR